MICLFDPIPRETKFLLLAAICHQNLIGWDNFLKGFTSSMWKDVQNHHPVGRGSGKPWDSALVEKILHLQNNIWDDQNLLLHGNGWQDAKRMRRERLLDTVRDVYKYPPKLNSRYPKVT